MTIENVIFQFEKYLSEKGITENKAIVEAAYSVLHDKPAKAGGVEWWVSEFKDTKTFVEQFVETADSLSVADKWATDYENGVAPKTVEEISALFVEYLTATEITDPAKIVEAAYDVLGGDLTPKAGGVAWWVGQKLTPEALAAEFIKVAGTLEQASKWADELESGEGEPGEPSSLTEALADYQSKAAEVATFLKEVDLDGDGVAENTTAVNVKTTHLNAKVSDVDDAIFEYNGTNGTINGYKPSGTGNSDGVFSSGSAAIRDAIISEVKAAMEAEVSTTLAKVNKTEGLKAKADALETAETAYNTAADAFTDAVKELNAEIAKFVVLNGAGAVALTTLSQAADATALEAQISASGPFEVKNGSLAIKDANKKDAGVNELFAAAQKALNTSKAEDNAQVALEAALLEVLKAENTEADVNTEFFTNTVTVTTAHTSANATAKTYTLKIDGVVYSVNVAADAADADVTAIATSLVAAVNKPNVTNAAGVITIVGTNNIEATEPTADNDATAQAITPSKVGGALITTYYTELNEASLGTPGTEHDAAVDLSTKALKAADVEAYAEAVEILAEFEKAVTEYTTAKGFADELIALEQARDAALQVLEDQDYTIKTDYSNGTADKDIYVFSDDVGAPNAKSIVNFGAQNEDSIFFGEGYKLVALGDKAITASVGDAAQLEIFYKETSAGLELYVEKEEFGGNLTTSTGLDEITKITLTGVSFADITDDLANGFITAGDAIA